MPNFASSDGLVLSYGDCGTGRPLVFIHGWAMSARVWHFQHSLAADYRLVTLDLRGHGNSSSLKGNFDLERLASDIVDLFSHLDLSDAVLVGWSMGGQVALQAYEPLRERLAALVLVGSTPRFCSDADYPMGLPSSVVKGMVLRLKRDYSGTLGDFFRSMLAPGEAEREQYQRIVHQVVMGGHGPNPEVSRHMLQLLGAADQRHLLYGIDLPVMLVHGSEDTICMPSASQYMAARLPHATLRMIPGCGHAPFMTRPEVFNPMIRDFVNYEVGPVND